MHALKSQNRDCAFQNWATQQFLDAENVRKRLETVNGS
jgi:hypothetical protein